MSHFSSADTRDLDRRFLFHIFCYFCRQVHLSGETGLAAIGGYDGADEDGRGLRLVEESADLLKTFMGKLKNLELEI